MFFGGRMNQEKWRDFYRKANRNTTWVKVMLKNGRHFFFSNYKEWLSVKDFCEKENSFISEMELQFRSHRITIDLDEETEGVYFVPSIMGFPGAPSKNFFTVGLLKNDLVHKSMWLVPELIPEKQYTDPISNCIEEALIYNEEKKTNREE
jgi:hypothetical protein